MSRKAKGPGYTPRSGKSPAFKNMGSSPVKYTNALTGEKLNPYAPDIIKNLQAMGVSSDVMQKIIENKTKGEIEDKENRTEKGTNVNLPEEVDKSVKKVDKIKKIKPKKTDMDELRAKQRRMSKGQSEYQYRNSKEYKDSKKTKGLKDLSGTPDTDPVDLTRKTDGAPIAGGSGSKTSYSPPETSELSFSDKKSVMGQSAIGTFEDDPENPMFGVTYRYSDIPVVTDEFNNPIYKKSPYKKGLGKYTKQAKGSRGYKMKK